jgi:hypothetical protein
MTSTTTADLTPMKSLKPDKKNGAYVFNASGCAGCHMDPQGSNRLLLVGGQSFSTPFGMFYAPNISMSKGYGIGEWTLANFRLRFDRVLAQTAIIITLYFPTQATVV